MVANAQIQTLALCWLLCVLIAISLWLKWMNEWMNGWFITTAEKKNKPSAVTWLRNVNNKCKHCVKSFNFPTINESMKLLHLFYIIFIYSLYLWLPSMERSHMLSVAWTQPQIHTHTYTISVYFFFLCLFSCCVMLRSLLAVPFNVHRKYCVLCVRANQVWAHLKEKLNKIICKTIIFTWFSFS